MYACLYTSSMDYLPHLIACLFYSICKYNGHDIIRRQLYTIRKGNNQAFNS